MKFCCIVGIVEERLGQMAHGMLHYDVMSYWQLYIQVISESVLSGKTGICGHFRLLHFSALLIVTFLVPLSCCEGIS